jgi:hypothetical protein
MFILPMTPFCHDEIPSIIFDQFYDLTDFQDNTSLFQIVLGFSKNIRFPSHNRTSGLSIA